jgi:NAD(P)-dependent dehydrogenase (short-subunit alcohol dehydrogenase family)
LREVRPSALVLNAGASPGIGTIDTMSWEDFEKPWQTDVKAAFHWVQEAIALPLPRGSRVILGSSGAAVKGSPMSGGYAGSKRAVWLMAQYANYAIADRDLGIHFQTILPMQIMGDTELGRAGAKAYADRKGISIEKFLESFGPDQLNPKKVGDLVATLLSDPRFATGVAFGLKGDAGLVSLDG